MKEDLDMLTQEDWALCVRDTEILQEEDFANEIGRDEILEPTVINIHDTEIEDEECEEGSSNVTGAGGR
jgi:hypothetical protein